MRTTSAKRRFRTSSWMRAEEVVRLVVVLDLKFGVPGDPEGVPTQDLDPGEERLEIPPDHLLQRHELVGQEKRHPARQDLGHLHPGEPLLAIRAPEYDRERKAQVRDVGERMPWIHRERREDREDVGVEVGVEAGPLVRRYVPESRMEHHPVIGQLRQQLIVKTATVLPDQLPDRLADGAELRLRRHAVRRALHDAGRDLPLQPGHPHLEELVEVAAADPEELEPLQQWRPGVERLVEHPPVELQPGELAIDVERWVPEVEGGGCGGELEVGHRRNVPGCV